MYDENEISTRSKDNVKNAGEVFTPFKIVSEMLDLIPTHVWADHSCMFLEPTCGNGQFLVKIFEKRISHGVDILGSLNTMIGMDISEDNIQDARFRLYERACAQMKVMGIKPQSKQWWEMAVSIVTVTRNNIMKVKDSLKVMDDYGNGKGILGNAKFVFSDPTGNDEVMTEVKRTKLIEQTKVAFKTHSTKPTRTLAPFFQV